jgi:hypothetical protein
MGYEKYGTVYLKNEIDEQAYIDKKTSVAFVENSNW